jgi:hypothetical protein
MKRLRYVASVASLLLLSPFGDACAGPYDGQQREKKPKPGTIHLLKVRSTTFVGKRRNRALSSLRACPITLGEGNDDWG